MDVSWSVFLGHLGVDGDDCNSVVCHFKGCHCTRLPSTVFTALFAELIVHRGLLCPNLHTACMYLATQGSGYPSPSLPSFFGGSRGNNYLFSNPRKRFHLPFSVSNKQTETPNQARGSPQSAECPCFPALVEKPRGSCLERLKLPVFATTW